MQTANIPLLRQFPILCRPEAYRFFMDQLPLMDTDAGLARAAVAISMHALDDIDVEWALRRIDELSRRVIARSPSRRPAAMLANLHAVLFEEEGFAGSLEHYYNALNSYLPAVLRSGHGLPVLMSLVYKLVGSRAGLTVQGINAPGHFLVRVQCDNAWLIVDPFFGGQALSRSEAFDRLERVAGRELPRSDALLVPATHGQWLARIIGNLRQLFATEGRQDDLAAMTELAAALAEFERASQGAIVSESFPVSSLREQTLGQPVVD